MVNGAGDLRSPILAASDKKGRYSGVGVDREFALFYWLKQVNAWFVAAMVFAVPAQAVLFSDGNFLDADWSATVFYTSNGATETASQDLAGGNGGSWRHMTHTMPPAPGGGTSVLVFHQYAGGLYDPGLSGAITSIDYSEDQLQLNPPAPGAGVVASLALMQGGTVFIGPSLTFTHSGTGNWVTAGHAGLTETDFVDILTSSNDLGGTGAIVNPDFSAGALPISFGYYRANTSNNELVTRETTHGIDNWSVAINAEVPEPGAFTILGIGLAGLMIARRRRVS